MPAVEIERQRLCGARQFGLQQDVQHAIAGKMEGLRASARIGCYLTGGRKLPSSLLFWVTLTNNPRVVYRSCGVCGGDSRILFLHDETKLVVTVNSFGIAPWCKCKNYGYHVDIQNSRDYLCAYVELDSRECYRTTVPATSPTQRR